MEGHRETEGQRDGGTVRQRDMRVQGDIKRQKDMGGQRQGGTEIEW